ncbi:RNA polymerase sigma factor [Pseudogemmobacter sonorensis]|uniref:RNA polymerase sigma factor n=1 Tax=Pseudogemmobacter sonorensis TaxID=2989681 RepID=UPI0036B9B721
MTAPERPPAGNAARATETEDEIRARMIGLLPRLRAFARSLARSQHAADDLVQQTCEKALRNLGAYTPGTRLDSWLFRIMRNGWIDDLRAARRFETIEDQPETALRGEDGRETVMARLQLRAVERAMDSLPEEQRVVLMLVCVEGMRYREVAQALDLPEGTVMSRLSRARLALAERLEAGGGMRAAGGKDGKTWM